MPKKISTLKKLSNVKVISKKTASWVRPATKKVFSISRGFAFSARGNRLIKLRPTIPKEVFRAFLKIKLRGGENSSSGAVVLKKINVRGYVGNHFFKMNIGKHPFFVKVIEKKKNSSVLSPAMDLALTQYDALIEAKQLLKKSPPTLRNHFDVVSPQFAFVSKDYSFLVTDFVKLNTVSDIVDSYNSVLVDSIPFGVLNKGINFFENNGFLDAGEHNTFFSPKDKKFILFDLRKRN